MKFEQIFFAFLIVWFSQSFAAQDDTKLPGKAGIEAMNAKMELRRAKIKKLDWSKIQTVDELKAVVKNLIEAMDPDEGQ